MTPEERRADIKEAARIVRNERWDGGFFTMDSAILAEIPDDYLANLQSGVRPDTGPYIRAQHEWQRRLTMRHVRSSIWASVIGGVLGIIGVIAGVILGWWLSQISQARPNDTANRHSKTELAQPQSTPVPTPTNPVIPDQPSESPRENHN